MNDRDQTTTTSDQRGPLAPYQETGISSLVQERLRTIGIDKSIKEDRRASFKKRWLSRMRAPIPTIPARIY